jgi:hypothetical protein
MTAITDTGPGQLIRWHYLGYAVVALGVMTVAIVSHDHWFLNFVHVICGVLWTGIDLFVGFVIGPILRKVGFSVRREVIVRLVPRTLFLMPTLSIITGTTGWFLAKDLGFLDVPWPQFGWVAPLSKARSHDEPKNQTPKARLKRRLEKIRDAWDEFQTSRARDAVYGYLEAVFAIVEHYKVRRRTNKLLRYAFEFFDQPLDKNADPFTVVIRCTCGGPADNKMISKWARALRYAAWCKKAATRLKAFMKQAGGVNACAHQYAKLQRRRNRRD